MQLYTISIWVWTVDNIDHGKIKISLLLRKKSIDNKKIEWAVKNVFLNIFNTYLPDYISAFSVNLFPILSQPPNLSLIKYRYWLERIKSIRITLYLPYRSLNIVQEVLCKILSIFYRCDLSATNLYGCIIFYFGIILKLFFSMTIIYIFFSYFLLMKWIFEFIF